MRDDDAPGDTAVFVGIDSVTATIVEHVGSWGMA